MFVLNSDITIGNLRFSGVHEVRVDRSIHSYADRAIIRVPRLARIAKGKRAMPGLVATANLLNDYVTENVPVTIKLGYNGQLRTEFEGFVKNKGIGMPLEIECEGYLRLLRKKTIARNYKKTTAKELLQDATAGTGIDVVCPVDVPLVGIDAVDAPATKLIDHIKRCSDNTLSVFFIEPKKIWCGLVYTPYLAGTEVFNLPTVAYRLGYNCIQDNGLRLRVVDDPVQIIINGQLVNGDPVRTESKNKTAARKVKRLLNNVPDSNVLKQFAQEGEHQKNYSGYEGSLTAFLQPYCLPGYTASVVDTAHPERSGKYVIESTSVTFGVNGARRRVELGPKVGGA
jgi:hypothetical protein